MVTHDLDTLISLSSRVAVLCDQRIVAIGALAEVVKSSHRFITNFFQGERGKRALQALSEALVK
jgi:phospholipid/cholesterol/gamma-HCH transport system ATP-binding protein